MSWEIRRIVVFAKLNKFSYAHTFEKNYVFHLMLTELFILCEVSSRVTYCSQSKNYSNAVNNSYSFDNFLTLRKSAKQVFCVEEVFLCSPCHEHEKIEVQINNDACTIQITQIFTYILSFKKEYVYLLVHFNERTTNHEDRIIMSLCCGNF